ncbi:hypothetical protein BaRGS_00036435, partial [Batillaria attramentaria]
HPMTQHLEDDDDNDKEDVDEGDLTSGVTNIHDELLSTSDTDHPGLAQKSAEHVINKRSVNRSRPRRRKKGRKGRRHQKRPRGKRSAIRGSHSDIWLLQAAR